MEIQVKTDFGTVKVAVLDDSRLSVSATNQTSCGVNERGLTINKVEYNIRFYCKKFEDGWKIVEPGTLRTGPHCISGTRASFSAEGLTFAAEKKIAEYVFPAVIDYLKEHPEALTRAQLESTRDKREKLATEIRELQRTLEDKEKEFRSACYECASLARVLDKIKTEERIGQ